MPLLDLILLSAFLVSLYLGVTILRRFGEAAFVFGGMLVLDALLSGVALVLRLVSPENQIGELLGVVAIGGAVCLIVLPPMLRGLARRALMRDHLRIARFLVDLRELLQPNMGSRQERELIDTILAVRGGRTDEAIDKLREARSGLEGDGRARLDERIVMTYLYARQWDDAIEHYERLSSSGVRSTSVQLLVEMVRAYCEVSDLDAAAELVAHLESSSIREEPSLAFLLNRSRLVFLAFVGRTTAVERLAGPKGPLGAMPREARAFWSGVSKMHAGDKTGAEASLTDAIRYASRDARARELAEATLEQARSGDGEARAVPSEVAVLADTLTEVVLAAPPPSKRRGGPRLVGVSLSVVPVTTALVVLNIAAAVAIWLVFRSTADLGALIRSGANVKSATLGGQYWRWVTYMFIHVGLLHLAINAYGLWALGKITEQLYGSTRILFIYVAAGIVGGVASTLWGGPATSAGASGAVFGLLGAALVELGTRRKAYPRTWTRSLLGLLALLTVANVAVGFIYPMIDQAAHLGGLFTGGLLGLLGSRQSRVGETRAANVGAGAAAAIAVLLVALSAFGLATQSYGDAVAKEPRARRAFPGVTMELPASWIRLSDAVVAAPNNIGVFELVGAETRQDLGEALIIKATDEQFQGARAAGFDKADKAEARIGAPSPWRSRELVVSASVYGGRRVYRVIVFGRRSGKSLWVGSAYLPEHLVDDLRPMFFAALESAEADAPE